MMLGSQLGLITMITAALLMPGQGASQPSYSNTPTRVGAATTWDGVSASQWYTCATRADRTLWCWGNNSDGEFGDGTTSSSPAPVPAAPLGGSAGWASVATGYWHTCVTRVDGSLWCWGRNLFGQLGDGTTADSLVPVRVGTASTASTWATVATGRTHTCATRVDGSLWCWGNNGQGELGDRTTTASLVPVRVGSESTWVAVTAGGSHTCGLRGDHSLWCWGGNGDGQLGTGTRVSSSVPTRVGDDATTWAAVSAGHWHTCAITVAGSLWCWGRDEFGELGDGTKVRNRPSPVRVGDGATTWVAVAVGDWHTCATRADGSLWCWGSGYAFGLGSGIENLFPTRIGTAASWAAVSAGSWHTCARRTDGSLWCWGGNDVGQLGLA